MIQLLLKFSILWLCLFEGLSADNGVLRIEERLTTDREFYDQWMNLINVQARQYSEQVNDFPLNYALDEIGDCPQARGNSGEDVNRLKPSDIAIYAEMGHLSTYCNSNYSKLKAGLLSSCTHRASSMDLPSIDKFLRVFNPNITVIEENERDDLLSVQATNLADAIRKIPNYKDLWKMIVILPSIQDGEASETGQTAVEVISAIEQFHKLLPDRTFLVVVRTSGKGIWRDASHAQKACDEMLNTWRKHNQYNSDSVWNQVQDISATNFRQENFTVEIVPLLINASLSNLPEGTDLSALGYDCAHFSDRGLSTVHIALWNTLMSRTEDRISNFRPLPQPLVCPDPRCPYIKTFANSAFCIFVPYEDVPQDMAPQLIVLAILVLAVLLALLLLFCVCRRNTKTDDYRKHVKAFGTSFSSIKFIDEDN